VASLTPAQLKTLRDRLLSLHKTLLDADRAAYERSYGPVGSSGEWLQLVLGHEYFAWLRPFSGLIVRVDEWLASDDHADEERAAVVREADRLTALSASTEERAVRYRKSIDRSADAAVLHASIRDILDNPKP
jgi:hypothetical protein